MSSDYIPRLRRELLRAGATEPARWRWRTVAQDLRPLAAAAAVAVIALAVVLALPDRRGDETPAQSPTRAVELSYRVAASGGATAESTAAVMRERLRGAGLHDATVSLAGNGRLTITAPAAARGQVTALTQPGRLAMYDWETSVLGPRGTPAPAADAVTGGPGAGSEATLPRAEAEARAELSADARPVRALAPAAERWYAVSGEPALTNEAIKRARATVDPVMNEPIVAIDFTPRGASAFEALTREVAQRGSKNGAGGLEAAQHFAIMLDDRIISMPFIDFREVPNGIDGSNGAQITAGLTPESARRLAALLSAGPLPADLTLESERTKDG